MQPAAPPNATTAAMAPPALLLPHAWATAARASLDSELARSLAVGLVFMLVGLLVRA
jgi:hypothetical protein